MEKDFLTIHDLTPEEVEGVLDLAANLKAMQANGTPHRYLEGKTLGMIFEKSSTRTRVSFEVGMFQLGGSALFLSSNDTQLGRGEPIRDTARVLSCYLDGIMIRTYAHETAEELAQWADIPVINALTDLLHPCQVMADLLTMREHKGKYLSDLKVAFVGDGNNMANSYLYGAAKTGMTLAVATPDTHRPDKTVVEKAMKDAKETGAELILTNDPAEAVKNADVIVTDTWASMGQEDEHDARKKIFAPYQVNKALLKKADRRAIVMHCLPAYRGEEITDEVFEVNADVIFDEAENRLHAQKAIMTILMG